MIKSFFSGILSIFKSFYIFRRKKVLNKAIEKHKNQLLKKYYEIGKSAYDENPSIADTYGIDISNVKEEAKKAEYDSNMRNTIFTEYLTAHNKLKEDLDSRLAELNGKKEGCKKRLSILNDSLAKNEEKLKEYKYFAKNRPVKMKTLTILQRKSPKRMLEQLEENIASYKNEIINMKENLEEVSEKIKKFKSGNDSSLKQSMDNVKSAREKFDAAKGVEKKIKINLLNAYKNLAQKLINDKKVGENYITEITHIHEIIKHHNSVVESYREYINESLWDRVLAIIIISVIFIISIIVFLYIDEIQVIVDRYITLFTN